ncbi:hypothetical protein NKH77_19975 [Streptomyces sp. M19]
MGGPGRPDGRGHQVRLKPDADENPATPPCGDSVHSGHGISIQHGPSPPRGDDEGCGDGSS